MLPASTDTTSSATSKRLFASRLRAAMWARGWTEEETARRVREHIGEGARFARTTICRYRAGRCIPRLTHLVALSAVLGIDKSELLADNLEAKPDKPSKHPPIVDRGRKAARKAVPALRIEDRGTEVRLQINQLVPWPVALKMLQAMKGE